MTTAHQIEGITAHCPFFFCQDEHSAVREPESYEWHQGAPQFVGTTDDAAGIMLRLVAVEDNERGTVESPRLRLSVPDRYGDPAVVMLDDDQALELAVAAMRASGAIHDEIAYARTWAVARQHDGAGHGSDCRCSAVNGFDASAPRVRPAAE